MRSRMLMGLATLLLVAGGLLLLELLPQKVRIRPPEPTPPEVTRAPTAPQPAAPPWEAPSKTAAAQAVPSEPPRGREPAKKARPPAPRQVTVTAAPAQAPVSAAPQAPAQTPAAAAPAAPPKAPPAVVPTDPFLQITAPAEGAGYHSRLELAGRVEDAVGAGAAGQIDSVTWSVAGTDRGGAVPFGPDGAFSTGIDLHGLNGNLAIRVEVRKQNGRAVSRKISLRDDGKGPGLVLVSPAENSPYAGRITVQGSVEAPGDTQDPTAELDSVSWVLLGTQEGGPVPPDQDGSFAFPVSAAGLRGDLVLQVQARDRNGRLSSLTRRLRERTEGPGLDITSPADNSVFGDTVTLEGRVGDPADPEGPGVKRLSWRAIGRPSLGGRLGFAENGDFSLSFSTRGITDDLVLELAAEDRDGRASVKAITLLHPPAPAEAAAPVSPPPQGGASTQAAPPSPPELTIESPANGGAYRSSVQVRGYVKPGARDKEGAQYSVSWAVAGTSLTGAAPVQQDGSFSFVVPTAGLRGTQALRLKAARPGGPGAEATRVLYEDARGLPLVIDSPRDGGFYQARTIVQGRVGDPSLPAAGELASLTWKIPARTDLTGHAVVDADGSFKVALPFFQLSGDLRVAFTVEDKSGRLTEKTLTLHDGTKKPLLAITAPVEGSQFGSLIRVAGSVTDPYAGTPEMAGIQPLTWMVSPSEYSRRSTPVRGSAEPGADGSFRFSIPTAGLAGPQQLTVTVRAVNGNEEQKTIRLAPGKGDVPGFAVSPGDRKAELSWEKTVFARRYDLSYGPAGGDRHAVRDVSPPFMITGLDNGSRYEFQLAVEFDDGGTGSSVSLQAIPLAPDTLAPMVKGDYQQIQLSWGRITGSSAYDVWRSVSRGSGYAKIASSLSATRYVDTSAEFGRDYFYAIGPSGVNAPLSAPRSGKTLAFPEDKLARLGAVRVPGARRTTIDGGYAFVAAGVQGVSIVDVSDPKSPVSVGRVGTRDARHVVVRGDYAYVADGDAGLRVLDISDPRKPTIIGSCKTADAQAVALEGPYAFVADGTRGLKVIDVSNARTLPRVAVLDTTDARDIALSAGRLYLADGAGGLKILDATRPLSPSLVATFPAADAREVAVHAGTAVLADGARGLRILNVADPARPVLASTFETDLAASVATDGRFAYLTDGKGLIKVVDIKEPEQPSLFTAHGVSRPVSVSVVGHLAYIADAAGMEIMRIQIYGRSFRVASCETGGRAFQVAVSGDWAYVAAHAGGLRVVNASDPSRLSGSSVDVPAPAQNAQSVSVREQLAFVADGSSGIRIFDMSPAWAPKPEAPVQLGSYRTGGFVHRVSVTGALAFAANGDQGVRIIDISDPAAPQEVGSLRTRDARDVLARQDVAWVADGDGGLRVIDVSDPAHPAAVSPPAAGSPGNTFALAQSGDLLLAAGTSGIGVFDVSNPRAPRLRGSYSSDAVRGLCVDGRYAYVAEGVRGLTVLDISRPDRPVVASSCTEVFATGVAVKGDYALITDSRKLLAVRILIPDWLKRQ